MKFLGADVADVLMEELAAVGRDQLATHHDVALARHDVELLGRDVDAGFERLRADMLDRLGQQRDAMDSHYRQLLFWNFGAVTTVAALAFGAASLA